jgi:hypothetical protein
MSRRTHDARARFTRALGCAIGAAVVDDDNFVRHTGLKTFAHDASDRFLLVQRRNDHRDLAHRRTIQAQLK